MKRSAFITRRPAPKANPREGEFASWSPPTVKESLWVRAVPISDGKARMVVPVPKHPPLRDEAYRRRVAALPCAHCKRPPPSQCAHGDEGKGMGMKASDDTCFPLCADGPGRRGCHSLIGASGAFTREQRRSLEAKYAAQTRAQLEIAA